MAALSIRRSIPALGTLALVALLAAACSGAATSPPATIAPAGSSPAGASGVVVSMTTTSLGAVLTGPNGLTLYTHAGDTATTSTCTGSCASSWPPLTVPASANATAGAGVTGTFATLTRADGTIQVTYNGLPLYGWQGDKKAGDVTGNGVGGFSVAKP